MGKLDEELVEAAVNGELEAVRRLVKDGADVNARDEDESTALMNAASEGFVDVVKFLIECEADVHAVDDNGYTALIWAAKDGHFSVVRHLVECGADVYASDNRGFTALIWAAECGHAEVVKHLIDSGADIGTANTRGDTALTCAAMFSRVEAVKLLIEGGADVNGAGTDNWPPLTIAASNGYLDLMTHLVQVGAEVNAATSDGFTALIGAASEGHVDAVKYLVKYGAEVNATTNRGWTALMKAASEGHVEVVKYLVKSGALLNTRANNGLTATIWAASRGHLEIVQHLIECGADVDAPDDKGYSAFAWAAKDGRLDVVKYFIECGADVNATDSNGETILMWAARNGHLDVAKYLIDCEADRKLTDSKGKTAFIFAAAHGRTKIVKYFIDKDADANSTDSKGRTALMLTAESGNLDIVKFLVERGANVNVADHTGRTPLMWAETDLLEITTYLVEHGADVNAVSNDGRAVLNWAARNCDWSAVEYLVEHGADVNTTGSRGETVLAWAAEVGDLDPVQFLVEHGAQINATDKSGNTALIMAAGSGHSDIVKYLLDHDADIRVINHKGLTAADSAARRGHLNIQRLLTQHSSRSTLIPIDTKPTLANAISSNHPELLISPFDLNMIQVSDVENSAADFVATWLDAPVALKLFVADAANTTFQDEVILWHQLRHPNVLKLYGVCGVGHNLFVCELANQRSVIDHLKSCEPESRTPWKYLHHSALGLAYLHERGIVHGDLRGSNILMGDDDQAKLANFSLSGTLTRDHESPIPSRGFIGSMRWQAPEVLKGEKPSEASDVYALGLCVVEMLTRDIPWHLRDELNARRTKFDWHPGSENDHFYKPAEVSEECRRLLEQICCFDAAARQSASACVRLFEDWVILEQDGCSESQAIHPTEDNSDEQNAKNSDLHNELPKLWAKVQSVQIDGTNLYAYQPVIDDLTQIYATIQMKSRPLRLMERLCFVLQDTLNMVRNTSQPSLAMQLSSTRPTGSTVHALRRRVDDLMCQLDLGIQDKQDPTTSRHGDDDLSHAEETQMFITEISKTQLILDELKTSEERLSFLSYLNLETNKRGTHYSQDQRDIIQQAYDEIQNKLDASDGLVANPVWFIPWYELVVDQWDRVGNGGFGSVYRAKWLNSEVVVKQVHYPSEDELAKRDEARKMFIREVNIWFHLSHPHVVRLFGACHIDAPFFVCEFAPNGALDDYLALHPDRIWQKLREASLGLLYLHERGIIHCDLKCNNVVIGSDGKAKVTDFGLSSNVYTAQNDARSSHVSGAWHWVAPEVLMGFTPTRESDVYSFGMCIVEALRVVAASQHDKSTVHHDEAATFPWVVRNHPLPNAAVKAHKKRGKLPSRPILCSNAQWKLIEKMCKFNPSERIQMCTVMDELSLLTDKHPSEQSTNISSQMDILAVATSMKTQLEHERTSVHDLGSRAKIYQIHELLWDRVKDIRTRVQTKVEDLGRLEQFIVDAQSRSVDISSHSDSLVDFTELALQAYDLHRRLDKLMAAEFVRIDNVDEAGKNVHDWKRRCYEILGVESSVAAVLM